MEGMAIMQIMRKQFGSSCCPGGAGIAGTHACPEFPEAQRTFLKVICKAIKML